MAFNGSGLFARLYSFVNDAANSINIRADRMDAEMDGIASGLSNCITRDGQGKPSAAIDWNGQNLSNVNTLGTNALTIATVPAQFDSTTKGTTTSFVQRALGNFSASNTVNSTTTLDASYVGAYVNAQQGAAYVITLPVVSTLPSGAAITILCSSTNGVTVAANGADIIYSPTGSSSLVLGLGDSVMLVSILGVWHAVGGTAALKGSASFGASLGSSGWQRLPGGYVQQWGSVFSANQATTTATFPIVFPNACYQVFASGYQGSGSVQANVTVNDATTAQCQFNAFTAASGAAPVIASAGGVLIKYFAIGR